METGFPKDSPKFSIVRPKILQTNLPYCRRPNFHYDICLQNSNKHGGTTLKGKTRKLYNLGYFWGFIAFIWCFVAQIEPESRGYIGLSPWPPFLCEKCNTHYGDRVTCGCKWAFSEVWWAVYIVMLFFFPKIKTLCYILYILFA